MKVPLELFSAQLEQKRLFLFAIPGLDPHFFICIATNDPNLYFVCCTSQFEKRKRYYELAGLPFECLVRIKPNERNGLSKDTYIDCTKYYVFTADALYQKYKDERFKLIGEIGDVDLEQILMGLEVSPTVEAEVKEIFARALKELLA